MLRLVLPLLLAATLAAPGGAVNATRDGGLHPGYVDAMSASLSVEIPLTPVTKIVPKLSADMMWMRPFTGWGLADVADWKETPAGLPRSREGRLSMFVLKGGVTFRFTLLKNIKIEVGATVSGLVAVPQDHIPISGVVDVTSTFLAYEAAGAISKACETKVSAMAEQFERSTAVLPDASAAAYRKKFEEWAAGYSDVAEAAALPWARWGRHAPFHAHLFPVEGRERTYRYFGDSYHTLPGGRDPSGRHVSLWLRHVDHGTQEESALHAIGVTVGLLDDGAHWEWSRTSGASWHTVRANSPTPFPSEWNDILHYVDVEKPGAEPHKAARAWTPALAEAAERREAAVTNGKRSRAAPHVLHPPMPPVEVSFLGKTYRWRELARPLVHSRLGALQTLLRGVCVEIRAVPGQPFTSAGECEDLVGGRALDLAERIDTAASTTARDFDAWRALELLPRHVAHIEWEVQEMLGLVTDDDRVSNFQPSQLAARTLQKTMVAVIGTNIEEMREAARQRLSKGFPATVRVTLDLVGSAEVEIGQGSAKASVTASPGYAMFIKPEKLETSVVSPFLGLGAMGSFKIPLTLGLLRSIECESSFTELDFPRGGSFVQQYYPGADHASVNYVSFKFTFKGKPGIEMVSGLCQKVLKMPEVGAMVLDTAKTYFSGTHRSEAAIDKGGATAAGSVSAVATTAAAMQSVGRMLKKMFDKSEAKSTGWWKSGKVTALAPEFVLLVVLGVDEIETNGVIKSTLAPWSFLQATIATGFDSEAQSNTGKLSTLLKNAPIKGSFKVGTGMRVQLRELSDVATSGLIFSH